MKRLFQTIKKKLISFNNKPTVEKRLTVEAFVLLGISRLVVLFVPMKQFASFLGVHMQQTPDTDVTAHQDVLRCVARAIRTAARYTPWESKCFAQAITAKVMLKHRHLPATLYLGVAKNKDRNLEAHAWLRCGSKIITGQSGMRRFTVVACFGE